MNYLPNGILLNANSTSTGGTTATFTDSFGRTWNLVGELDSDGHNVDITFNVSGVGQWTQKFDANAFAPTELTAATTVMTSMASTAGRVHRMSAGGVAAVAGAVAGVAAGVAGIAALIPGGQTVAVVAGAVAGVASAVAGVAACIDYFQNQKKNKK